MRFAFRARIFLAVCGLSSTVFGGGTTAKNGEKYPVDYILTGSWGSRDLGSAQFETPEDIAVAEDGTIYVTDYANFVQYFTSNGSFIGKWGSRGADEGQFFQPDRVTIPPGGDWRVNCAVAVAPEGTVYVADAGNNRVQYFTRSGSFLGQWGSEGSAPGEFDRPVDVVVGSYGNIYVAEAGNWRIQCFTSTGSFLGKKDLDRSYPWRLVRPLRLGFDAGGVGYVIGVNPDKVERYTYYGSYLGGWNTHVPGESVNEWLQAIAVGPDDTIFVADGTDGKVKRFSTSGSFLNMWGLSGHGKGKFAGGISVAVAADGTVYVADTFGDRVQYFHPVAPEDK